MGHLFGYARVFTTEQDPALQLDALTTAGCARNYVDRASGTLANRHQLDKLLEALLSGQHHRCLELDRHGRSLSHLLTTVTDLGTRGADFRSRTEGTTPPPCPAG